MGLLVRQGEGKGPRAGAEAGRGRGTAAGIYEIRRLRRGRCGGLWGRPSSRPAVARYPARPCRSAALHYLAVSRLEGFSRETRPEKSSRSIFAWARCIAR